MTEKSIEIMLSDERLAVLQELADRYQISTEDLIRAGIDDLISRTDAEFRDTLKHVMDKNSELYDRLA